MQRDRKSKGFRPVQRSKLGKAIDRSMRILKDLWTSVVDVYEMLPILRYGLWFAFLMFFIALMMVLASIFQNFLGQIGDPSASDLSAI